MMARLGNTVARLLRQQSDWGKRFSNGLEQAVPPSVRGTGLLEEVEDSGTNPGNLRMFRYIPRIVQPKPPLVVALHGCTQQAAAYADGAGWVELADRYGFCLLMPEQRRANNPNLCFNWFVPGDTTRGSGEVQSIRQMIARTVADWGIDQARVFITGLSAGGAMTSAMLATYPEVFAGGAIIAGLPYQSASNVPSAFQVMADARIMPAAGWANLVRSASPHEGPWPKVSIWQGAADQTVDPQNSGEIAKQWTQLHGTGQKPDAVEKNGIYTRRVWNDAAGEPAVEEYVVAGLGHGTPLATGDGQEHFGTAAPFLLEAGLSSSYRIAKFWDIARGEPTRVYEPAAPAIRSTPDQPLRRSPQVGAREENGRSDERTRRASAPPARYDIAAIINRALKSAGLIK